MEGVLINLLNMSIAASWLILAVVILRFLLKKAPKSILCALWVIVAIRLICPIYLESVLSLIPSAETISPDIVYSKTPSINSGIPAVNGALNPIIYSSFAPGEWDSANPLQIWISIASAIWLIGVAVMVLYTVISFFRLNRKISEAVVLKDNIFLLDRIDTPFIFGVIHPRIFLPSAMDVGQIDYVMAHENAHLQRRDHWWKPIGFVLLTVYWFNPLCWLAYWLLCKDIELACDERVIKDMDAHNKKAYSEALLSCSVTRRTVMNCPLAFGEVAVKARITSVLKYKKPSFWLITVAFVVAIVLAVCFLTNPKEGQSAGVDVKTNGAREWFNYYMSKDYPWNSSLEIALPEFPEATFRWQPEKIEAVTNKETVALFGGMPIWNVYFADLTGDKLPELCATVSIGSGIIDTRVIVYDYVNLRSYELADRMNYDYSLTMQDDVLYVVKSEYTNLSDNEAIPSVGLLKIGEDGTLQMES